MHSLVLNICTKDKEYKKYKFYVVNNPDSNFKAIIQLIAQKLRN